MKGSGIYQHSAPLEPAGDEDSVLQTFGSAGAVAGMETRVLLSNGACRKLGRPRNGRPYEVIFIVSGRRQWRHERLHISAPLEPGRGWRLGISTDVRLRSRGVKRR